MCWKCVNEVSPQGKGGDDTRAWVLECEAHQKPFRGCLLSPSLTNASQGSASREALATASCYLFLQIKFYWNKATPVCCILLRATLAHTHTELSSCNSNCMISKTSFSFYCTVLYRKKFPASWCMQPKKLLFLKCGRGGWQRDTKFIICLHFSWCSGVLGAMVTPSMRHLSERSQNRNSSEVWVEWVRYGFMSRSPVAFFPTTWHHIPSH